MNKSSFLLITILVSLSICRLSSQEWLINFEEAKMEASNESKNILLVFQGSDWCAPCIKLHHQVWSKEVFLDYASDDLVLLQADFPRRKKNQLSEEQTMHNGHLFETYNQSGSFPLVVLLNSAGKVIGETGYKDMTPESYVSHLKTLSK